jgi:hypothetical protein
MSVSGTWTLNFGWGCTGSYGQTNLYFNNDGTFTTDDGGSGSWQQVGGMVIVIYNVGANPSYAGNVQGSALVGIIGTPSGSSGCFYATEGATTMAELKTLAEGPNSTGA